MAEPISLASGLLTLATFAFRASTTLYKTVQSFQSHPKRVRDLEDELKALSGVLHALTDTVSVTTDVDFSALDFPLLRCGKACEEFKQELMKCSSRSTGSRNSSRDWAKLRYLGDDIDGFRQLLAGYKATINIALTSANLRKSSTTALCLQNYKDLIQNTADDLEARLKTVDKKLEMVLARATDDGTAELKHIEEERLNTQDLLLICAQFSEHANQLHPRMPVGLSFADYGHGSLLNTFGSSGTQIFNTGDGPQNNNIGIGKQYIATNQHFGIDD